METYVGSNGDEAGEHDERHPLDRDSICLRGAIPDGAQECRGYEYRYPSSGEVRGREEHYLRQREKKREREREHERGR